MFGDMIFLDKPGQLDMIIPSEMYEAGEISIANKVAALNTHDLKKKFRLFHRFIAYNIIPKGGHYNQVSTLGSFIMFVTIEFGSRYKLLHTSRTSKESSAFNSRKWRIYF